MPRKIPLHKIRILVQILALCGVLWLFVQTEYRGQDLLPYPVGLLFRLDPLAALAVAFAPGSFVWGLLWPALLLVALTVLFGRFFCGWLCPLGTSLDGLGRLVGRGGGPVRPAWRRVKFYLLLLLLMAALGGLQVIGLFDPLAIFLRTLTLAIYPAVNLVANALFDFFYSHRVPLVSSGLDAIYPFSRDHILAFHPPAFRLALFTCLVFFAILLLEKVERRFWCKNLCPLGALLGICSRYALLQRTPSGLCPDCRVCSNACRSGAVSGKGWRQEECLVCFDCEDYCPETRVNFGFRRPPEGGEIDLKRRGILTSLAAGAILAPVSRVAPALDRQHSFLLRPPGARAEQEFLQRCIRCGECMKVCIGGALHPALFEAGGAGLWSPLVVPRIGYCEYNCTLCGQVCPTGAIEFLPLEKKRKTVIGIAVFDKDRCLPFARGEECLVCEEHCPTGEKAIVFTERQVLVGSEPRLLKLPRVVKERCIGCGICETRCPLDGRSAIRVVNEAESRKPRDFLA
ncbi:4Fe-4S binding protein [Desulfuromonas carbonis]|uniref:4Fe-4S binding protein n=1 Tax=Desulfuromonas sp. DDH964 TaxID=1823759 RepID=UPI000837312F|nr:4Fe-4S binding protein [Desulfuromonas sp. DDH964]